MDAAVVGECPVCFQSVHTTVSGPCNHELCLSCAKRIMLSPASCTVPTRGRCPICRAPLSIFDVHSDPLPSELLHHAIYATKEGVGYGSMHFKNGNLSFNRERLRLPSQFLHTEPQWKYYAEAKCLEITSDRSCIIMSFSDDFGFSARAYMRQNPSDGPYDGLWKVGRKTFEVTYGFYFPEPYRIFMIEIQPDGSLLRTEDDTRWRADQPTAPSAAGPLEFIEWTVVPDEESTKEEPRRERWEYQGPNSSITNQDFVATETAYRRIDPPMSAPHISYCPDQLLGNVFVQSGGLLGLASYHFDGPDQMNICYQHQQAVTRWPPLDDGRPIPARMLFTEVSVEQNVFRGVIDWYGTLQTTWLNMQRWEYEIHFDINFLCILSGTVKQGEGDPLKFGEELTYVNAALFTSREARNHVSIETLQSKGASAKTVAFLERTMSSPVTDGLSFQDQH